MLKSGWIWLHKYIFHFLDKEMVTLFINTFMASYNEHIIGSSTQQFIDSVAIAERIE